MGKKTIDKAKRRKIKLGFIRIESPKFKDWEDLCRASNDGQHLLIFTDSMRGFGYYLCNNGQKEYSRGRERNFKNVNYYKKFLGSYITTHFTGGNRDRNFPNKITLTIETICKDTTEQPIMHRNKPRKSTLEEKRFNDWYARMYL